MFLSLIALAAGAASHNIAIEHHGSQLNATYSAQTDMRSKTVGAHTPNRMDMQRCNWTATVRVERSLDGHGPALTRTLPGERRFSGSAPGACSRSDDAAERHLAQHDDAIQAHVVAVAEADRAPLLAELDAVRNLAAN